MWVYDIARGVKPLLSTAPEGDDFHPVWSPSGEEVAFSSNRAGNFDIFLTPADGGGEELLLATADNEVANDWSRDGNHLLVNITVPETADDLWYLERNGAGNGWEPHPFLQTPSNEYYAKFSPDGRYVAYVSDRSGQVEIYVRPFPEGSPEVTASSNGGTKPRWRRDGKELLYLEGNKVMAVSVSMDPSFSAGSPTLLFEHPSLEDRLFEYQYDVSADGQRFVLTEPAGEAPEPSIHVVQNWYEEFRDREQD